MLSPTTSRSPPQNLYRPDIDGLRAIAVLAVVIFHASPRWLPGGFIGVDIFFVISGFLISGILLDGLAKADFSYADFYARRIRRIFPALSLVLLATFGAGWYILLPDEFRQLGKHVLTSTGFIANTAFWNEAGYFDTAVETKPLLHLWSLAVEEQFYIFWPAVVIFAWRSKRVFFWTLFAIVVSFVINVAVVKRYPDFAFYLPLTRVWELGAGALIAWWVRHREAPRLPAALRSVLVLAGLICIGAGLALINRNKHFPGYWALLPVLGACLCIGSGPDTWIHRRLLGSPPFVWIGLISYPLYLWHWPLLAYARVLQDGFSDPPRCWRLAAVAIAGVLAWLTYRFVEQPIRHQRRRGVVIWLAGAMVALGAFGALAFKGPLAPRNGDPSIQAVVAAGSDWVYPDEMQSFRAYGQTFEKVPGGPRQVVLIGDSHIEQYRARAMELAKEHPGKAATMIFATRGACPPIPRFMEPRDPMCEEKRGAAFEFAKQPDISAVILGGCWACYFDLGDAATRPTSNSPPPPDRFYYVDKQGKTHYLRGGDGVERSIEALGVVLRDFRKAGKTVYLILNIPVGAQFEPRVRLAVGRGSNMRVPLMDARPDDRAVERKLAAGRLRNISVLAVTPTTAISASQLALHDRLKTLALDNGAIPIDPQASLCLPDGQCLRTDAEGGPIYKDATHLRAAYVRNMATFLDAALLSNP